MNPGRMGGWRMNSVGRWVRRSEGSLEGRERRLEWNLTDM